MSEKQVLKRQTLCTTLLKNRIISNAYLLRALFLLQLHLRLFINSIKNPHEIILCGNYSFTMNVMLNKKTLGNSDLRRFQA